MANYLEGAIRDRLTTDDGVAAIVGAKVYRRVLPQGVTLPAIAIWMDGKRREHLMGGDSNKVPASLFVSCWADDDPGVQDLAAAVQSALQNYSGTHLSIVIDRSFLEDEYGDMEEQTRRQQVIQRYTVWYTEA
jgi:hypothetical protein